MAGFRGFLRNYNARSFKHNFTTWIFSKVRVNIEYWIEISTSNTIQRIFRSKNKKKENVILREYVNLSLLSNPFVFGFLEKLNNLTKAIN